MQHTVTSDNNAWPSSPLLDLNKTFSFTFTKAGTYTYHCGPHPFMTGTIIVGAASTTGTGGDDQSGKGGKGGKGSDDTTQGAAMGSMGPMSMAKLATWTGYYDDKKVTYLSTDTSSKDEAQRDHINYAPNLAKSVASAGEIYLVTNGKFASRGPVFDSQLGDAGYTPLWQEVLVTWKDPNAAVALGKDDQITFGQEGKVTLKKTGIVLNCPLLPAASSSHM